MAVVVANFTRTYHHSPYPAISPTRNELSSAGKVVVVTGAAGGIGSAMATAFVKSGAQHLVAIDLNEAGLLTFRSELEKVGKSTIHTFALDITNVAAVQETFKKIEDNVGKIDVLANNVGYQNMNAPFLQIDVNDWFRCFEINVKGTIAIAQAFVRHASPEAVLVNVSSILAHFGMRLGYMTTNSGYSASKTAITQALNIIQEELPNIRIVNMHPGFIPTQMAAKFGNLDISIDSPDLPAQFAVWLASPEADFLKGRFAWANWDVEEMIVKKEEILQKDLLRFELTGIE